MNDAPIDSAIELRFKLAVERAVRPLAATFARKRLLREELLAHLHSVYYDVLSDCSSEAEACERSLARFGDPRELTRELQSSVPRSDRLLSKVQWTPRPADLTPWGMLRWMFFFTVGFNAMLAAMVSILMLAEIARPRLSPFFSLAVMAICSIALLYPFQLIAMRLGQLSLEGRLTRNRKSHGLLLAASVCFPIWLTLVFCGLALELVVPWRELWPAYVVSFVLGPFLAILQGRRFVEDRRDIEQWASLAIED